MKLFNKTLAALFAFTCFNVMAGDMEDDPFLSSFKADKLELRDTSEGKATVMEFDAWFGKDLQKLWLKYSRESVDGTVESSELDVMYSKALTAWWDIQYGVRAQLEPSAVKDTWVGISLMGVAPYLFEVDTNAFVNSKGNINLRLDAEYEYLFTQKWVLVPNLEVNFYSQDDSTAGIQAGITSLELGARMQYRIRRDFMPYVGVNFANSFGNRSSSETQLLAGISFWF